MTTDSRSRYWLLVSVKRYFREVRGYSSSSVGLKSRANAKLKMESSSWMRTKKTRFEARASSDMDDFASDESMASLCNI